MGLIGGNLPSEVGLAAEHAEIAEVAELLGALRVLSGEKRVDRLANTQAGDYLMGRTIV
jgi:hypothetical protein